MKHLFSKILVICISLVLFLSFQQTPKKCIVKGKTIGVESDSVLIVKAGEDFRFEGTFVPIENNTFTWEKEIDHPVGYQLFLADFMKRGGGRYMTFIAEPGEIHITVHPEEKFDKNTVEGGKWNEVYKNIQGKRSEKFDPVLQPLYDSSQKLVQTGQYMSDTMSSLVKKVRTASDEQREKVMRKMQELRETGQDKSPRARKISEKIEKHHKEAHEWELEYIRKNPHVVSYFLLYRQLTGYKTYVDVEKLRNAYITLSEKLPDHPYTASIKTILKSKAKIKKGGRYIDFSAPDTNGNMVNLSEYIEGKIALIDFWSPWCGPCINHSRTLVPVYNKYKDDGFTILGVCQVFNEQRFDKVMKEERFPWLNLVEMKGKHDIWAKYGISNSGGKTFLIDSTGKILSVHPSTEELIKILEEKLE
jgi:peroxiredoxin/gas vesicle protein